MVMVEEEVTMEVGEVITTVEGIIMEDTITTEDTTTMADIIIMVDHTIMEDTMAPRAQYTLLGRGLDQVMTIQCSGVKTRVDE